MKQPRSPAQASPLDSAKNLRPLLAIRWLIVAALFIAAAILYPRLPEQIPTHWNFAGQPDQYSPKAFGTWLLPGIAFLMAVLFPLLRKLDPKRDSYKDFLHPWDVIQTAIVAFMGYIFIITMLATIDPTQSAMVGRYVVFGIGVLFVLLGNYMGKIRQNWFVGLRTPWTLSDPETWRKSQRFGGWMFVIGGLVILAEALVWWHVEWLFFAVVMLIGILPIIYSYLIFPREKSSAKKGITAILLLAVIGILVGAAIAITIRVASGEDDWTCQNGQWIQHGHPQTPMPKTPCP